MKTIAIALCACVFAGLPAGCGPTLWRQDPRHAPLDATRAEINDILACQFQAQRLYPLQEQLQQALLKDERIENPSVAFFFSVREYRPVGARLVVSFALRLLFKKDALPSTQPAELDQYVQDLVRQAMSECGWEVEDACTYNHENHWAVRGTIRGQGLPPAAGAGLELLPK